MAPQERAKALGWLSAATSLGVVIGPVLGSFAARGGASAPGLVAAALCLCNVVFAWRWLPESRVLASHVTTASGRHVAPAVPRRVLGAVGEAVPASARAAAHVVWVSAVPLLAH